MRGWRALAPGARCAPDIFEQLPSTMRDLSRRSLRVQERVIHLDQSLALARAPDALKRPSEVASQHERLREAFSNEVESASLRGRRVRRFAALSQVLAHVFDRVAQQFRHSLACEIRRAVAYRFENSPVLEEAIVLDVGRRPAS